MSFDRQQILVGILNGLTVGDDLRFRAIAQAKLSEAAARNNVHSLGVFSGIIRECGDEIENRGLKIINEMRRVLDGSKIDDFGELGEVLRSLYLGEIDALAKFAERGVGGLQGPIPGAPKAKRH